MEQENSFVGIETEKKIELKKYRKPILDNYGDIYEITKSGMYDHKSDFASNSWSTSDPNT